MRLTCRQSVALLVDRHRLADDFLKSAERLGPGKARPAGRANGARNPFAERAQHGASSAKEASRKARDQSRAISCSNQVYQRVQAGGLEGARPKCRCSAMATKYLSSCKFKAASCVHHHSVLAIIIVTTIDCSNHCLWSSLIAWIESQIQEELPHEEPSYYIGWRTGRR
jgi:hypothetical protein